MDSPLKHLDFLKNLVAPNANFKKILDESTECESVAILLVIYNIYTGIVPINSSQRKIFKRAKPFLTKVLSKKIGLKTKKNLIKSRSRLIKRLVSVFLSHG